jgi:hypothetical protein
MLMPDLGMLGTGYGMLAADIFMLDAGFEMLDAKLALISPVNRGTPLFPIYFFHLVAAAIFALFRRISRCQMPIW